MDTGAFLWGVASSGYQCEGGYNGPGQPHNNWAAAEVSGAVARTGGAADFWNRFEEDFRHCRGMGLRAFRLSVEWARVQPSFSTGEGPPPAFDTSSIDAYADRIAACRAHGMEPVVTLHHFTHPAWLGPDAWLRDDTPALFEAFVRTATSGINARLATTHHQPPVRWYVTLNEPNMLVINTYMNRHFPGGSRAGLAVGVEAYNRLLAAHVRAYNAIHDAHPGSPPPVVTMNTFCSDAYWSEQMLLDLLFSRERGIARADLAAHLRAGAARLRKAMRNAQLNFPTDPLVWIGRLLHLLIDSLAPRHATGHTFAYFLDELDRSKRPRVLDCLGLDYYDPFTAHMFRPPSFGDLEFETRNVTSHLMAGLSRKWWDWHVLPEGLHFFCSHYAKEFPGLGILVAENGMAMRCKPDGSLRLPRRDKLTRSTFLEAHVAQIQRLRAEGIPMLGYLHWSITDNYEWGSFTPRFGLLSLDYTDRAKRHPTDHLGDCPSATYARLIAADPGGVSPRANA
jgi:beta-glucosidase